MKILDLFAGIGGFSLAAHWLNWQTIAFVEKDEFCRKVLAKNFPSVPIFNDVKTFNGKYFNGSADIICGGFPCQPHSIAGKRAGRKDERFLWNAMFRVIQDCQPRWVVAENVRGLLSDESGLVFENVCSDLESASYAVQSFIVPACAVDAPHRRQRVWIIAYSDSFGRKNEQKENRKTLCHEQRQLSASQQIGDIEQRRTGEYVCVIADTDGEQRQKTRLPLGKGKSEQQRANIIRSDWTAKWNEVAARVCRVADGLPDELHVVGSRDNRKTRLRALGNAVVPQIPFEIFKAIEAAEKEIILSNQSSA